MKVVKVVKVAPVVGVWELGLGNYKVGKVVKVVKVAPVVGVWELGEEIEKS